MFDIVAWINGIVGGIVFGIFPLWWLCTALIMKNRTYRKYLPTWLVEGFDWNPGFGFFQIVLNNKTYYPLMLQITAIAWVVVCIGGYHIAAWNYYKNDIIQIIEIETSATLFLLVTSFVPYFLIKRYLEKRIKKDGNFANIVRSEPVRLLSRKQIHQQFLLIGVSLIVICILFLTSNTEIDIPVILSLAGIIGVVVIVYIRLIRKSNDAK